MNSDDAGFEAWKRDRIEQRWRKFQALSAQIDADPALRAQLEVDAAEAYAWIAEHGTLELPEDLLTEEELDQELRQQYRAFQAGLRQRLDIEAGLQEIVDTEETSPRPGSGALRQRPGLHRHQHPGRGYVHDHPEPLDGESS